MKIGNFFIVKNDPIIKMVIKCNTAYIPLRQLKDKSGIDKIIVKKQPYQLQWSITEASANSVKSRCLFKSRPPITSERK